MKEYSCFLTGSKLQAQMHINMFSLLFNNMSCSMLPEGRMKVSFMSEALTKTDKPSKTGICQKVDVVVRAAGGKVRKSVKFSTSLLSKSAHICGAVE
jgi:hypothetical protein